MKQGGAGAVMCAFPRINGTYACENAHLFDILKHEWGFDGSVGPDFPSAQRSITRAVLAGLDSGSFAPTPFNAALANEKPLSQAVKDGDVPEARIDDMILRRLVPLFRLGQYDNPPGKGAADVSTPEHRQTAAEILEAGTVLLKNDGGILPLGKLVKSIALIGPQATADANVVEQGSPYVKPTHLQPVLPAVTQRAGDRIAVTYAAGTLGLGPLPPFDPASVTTAGGEPGFRAEYFANPNLDFSGTPLGAATVADPSLDKTPPIEGLPKDNQWSVRYTGMFTPAESGMHRFTLHGSGTARLLVDGKPAARLRVGRLRQRRLCQPRSGGRQADRSSRSTTHRARARRAKDDDVRHGHGPDAALRPRAAGRPDRQGGRGGEAGRRRDRLCGRESRRGHGPAAWRCRPTRTG